MNDDGTGSVYDNTGWYLVSIKLVLLDIRWYRVSKGLVCLIYWKKSIFGQVSPMPDRQTDRQQNEVLLSMSKL